MEIARADQTVVETKRRKDAVNKAKVDRKHAELDALELLLDVAYIRENVRKIRNDQLDLQLDWHRQNEGEGTKIKLKSHVTRKSDKIEELCAAVDRYLRSLPSSSREGDGGRCERGGSFEPSAAVFDSLGNGSTLPTGTLP